MTGHDEAYSLLEKARKSQSDLFKRKWQTMSAADLDDLLKLFAETNAIRPEMLSGACTQNFNALVFIAQNVKNIDNAMEEFYIDYKD